MTRARGAGAGRATGLAAGIQRVAGYTSAGLAGSAEVARFLRDSGVAAVAWDNPAVEVVPVDARRELPAPPRSGG